MFKNLILTTTLLFAVLWCFSVQAAIPVDSIVDPRTAGTGYISDVNHALDNSTAGKVNEILKRLDEEKKAQVAVVIINTIGDGVPKDFATELFRDWKIGYKGLNNGLLVLIIKDQRRVEIEVGYGLEGSIPDIISNHIQQQAMIPNLKKGDYDAAVLEGVKMISGILTDGATHQDSKPVYNNEKEQNRQMLSLIFCALYVVFTFVFVILARKPKLRRSSLLVIISVIAGPVIFVILLGTLSPLKINFVFVLLAIYFCWAIFYGFYFNNIQVLDPREETHNPRQIQYSKWNTAMQGLKTYTIFFPFPILIFFYRKVQKKMKDLRYSPYLCEQCKKEMQLVTMDSASYLTDGEKMAEQLGTVTYDIWKCENGHAPLKVPFIKEGSEFCECQKCKNLTAHIVSHTIENEADYLHKGSGIYHYACQYCKAEFNVSFVIPQMIAGYSGNSSSDSDSDSGSSGSSDSWGGGSSGGGGSGSNWEKLTKAKTSTLRIKNLIPLSMNNGSAYRGSRQRI
ncbi:Uncharacterized membrane protein YgcG, contains a TPM-fold domain [Pedobacter westerhofensis]|uniref:Uncharacterized membrane protein YgcG, contains a TPM-fold domain n=1 Tax=Pedobacter westerhofensis TaxID=425512 RepID=A0A521EA73_9SPHI|nr:TPM domain-containing protein [Pedobacter westerhofensis]SMO80845.1 Uncharacterized membrane protein YgcG, contains a TPM-fold domain [Pedobacter westerhofensis]